MSKKPSPFVLVVDDDLPVREGICRVLGSEALQVVAARGVKDALEHIFRHTPDLIITDMCMAPLAGWDLIAHLRSQYRDLPIFVVTALPVTVMGKVMRDIQAYFQKPLDLDALVSAIRSQLGRVGSTEVAPPFRS